ncbi:MAG: hypothetical protein IPM91_03030 [Bacteroidetes bacterium]|nr:hypothetical protein [Bacteroidota bacterium]
MIRRSCVKLNAALKRLSVHAPSEFGSVIETGIVCAETGALNRKQVEMIRVIRNNFLMAELNKFNLNITTLKEL